MYQFIDNKTVKPYRGENLKFYVGNRLVRIIANPSDEQLKNFGYKNMIETALPECDENHYLDISYQDGNEITKIYTLVEIPKEEIAEEINDNITEH